MAELATKDTVVTRKPSPTRAAEMLRHMSKKNSANLYQLIVTVYNGDETAQKYEKKKLDEKREAFNQLEKMRKELSISVGDDFDPEKELMSGLEEKYGSFD